MVLPFPGSDREGAVRRRTFACVVGLCLLLMGCVTIVAPYDPAYDQGLGKLSESTARFLANAEAGFAEKTYASREATEYYAVSFNFLALMLQRARATRALVPCPTNPMLGELAAEPTIADTLPEDAARFDCREAALYLVRLRLLDLQNRQKARGTLTEGVILVTRVGLQNTIAIDVLMLNKPPAAK